MKKNEAISILATSVRPREQKDIARYDEAVKMAIDALNEPERKTGKWNRRKGMYEIGFKCSECNTFSIAETPYCSFCGSHMVQEGEDNERA